MTEYVSSEEKAELIGAARRSHDIVGAKRELDKRTLAELKAKLQPGEIERTVDQILEKQLSGVVLSLLGFETSFGEWRMKGSDSPLRDQLNNTAAVIVQKHLPEVIASIQTKIGKLKEVERKKLESVFADTYAYAFRDKMAAALRERARHQAESDVEAILIASQLVPDDLLKTDEEIKEQMKKKNRP